MARASPLLPAPGCASRPHYLLTETQPLAASQGTRTGVLLQIKPFAVQFGSDVPKQRSVLQ